MFDHDAFSDRSFGRDADHEETGFVVLARLDLATEFLGGGGGELQRGGVNL
jgi:hypothetical protein